MNNGMGNLVPLCHEHHLWAQDNPEATFVLPQPQPAPMPFGGVL